MIYVLRFLPIIEEDAFAGSHGLGLPDALIAAIALGTEHTLVTGNVRDFVCIEHLHVVWPPYRP